MSCVMMNYRLYMLDEAGKIFHGQDFKAPDSDSAVATGEVLFGILADAARDFEIWTGPSLVFSSREQASQA